jgi:hypothetical protein
MSLVHEALQKAEREKQRKAGVWTAPTEKSSPQPVQPFGVTESPPTVPDKSAATDSPANDFRAGKPTEPIATMSTASHAMSVASGASKAGQSVDQTAAVYAQKKQSGLLAVLIVCVSLVAIVAIVFLVSLAASGIREARQAGRPAAAAPPTHVAAATEPKPNEPAPQPVVASPAANVASEPMGLPAQQPPAPVAGPAESGFRLTGIMIVPDGRYAAVINAHVVYESSYVDGATVKSIQRDRVTLVDALSKEIVLRLN